MKNRIHQTFGHLAAKNKKAFVPYITAGYPDQTVTRKLVQVLAEAGADMIELGMPFSDPVADGPLIQEASSVALKGGMSVLRFLDLVKDLRDRNLTQPLIMMSYYNPLFRFGVKRFCRQARSAGLDGLIIPDLPPEESGQLRKSADAEGLSLTFLVSPLSRTVRIKEIVKATTGFVYYVSLAGVTGVRGALSVGLKEKVGQVKRLTDKPVYVGFGVSLPKHVQEVTDFADGVIIGSAIIDIIRQNSGRMMYQRLKEFAEAVSRQTLRERK